MSALVHLIANLDGMKRRLDELCTMPFRYSAPQITSKCTADDDSDIAAVQATGTPTIPAEPACIATDSGVQEASTLKAGDATRPGSNAFGCCPICADDEVLLITTNCGFADSHAACHSCLLRHIRSELVPNATCVRCPQCLANGRISAVSEETLAAVAEWSRRPDRPSPVGVLRPLPEGPLFRAANAAADLETRELCDSVAAMALVGTTSTEAEASTGSTIQESLSGQHKTCPGCGIGILRERGHHCHHIAPGTGCPSCGTHFCYACLHEYDEDDDVHDCPNGCPVRT